VLGPPGSAAAAVGGHTMVATTRARATQSTLLRVLLRHELEECLLPLNLKDLFIAKCTCTAFRAAARTVLNLAQWQAAHIRLTALNDIYVDLAMRQQETVRQDAAKLFGGDMDCKHWELPDQGRTRDVAYDMARARQEPAALDWLSRAVRARVQCMPEEARERASHGNSDTDPDKYFPLHIALQLGLDLAAVDALEAAHPISADWRLADLLAAGARGEQAALARMAQRPNEVRNGDLRIQALWMAGFEDFRSQHGLSPDQPTFLYLALEEADRASASVIGRLLQLHPAAMRIRADRPEAHPIHAALFNGPRPDTLALLLAAEPPGVVASTTDCFGAYPLAAALSRKREPAIIRALLHAYPAAARERANCQPLGFDNRAVPLHLAASYADASVVQDVLEAHPEAVTAEDSRGHLPHHYAARAGAFETLLVLHAAYPAGVRHEARDGTLPFDEAMHFAAESAMGEPASEYWYDDEWRFPSSGEDTGSILDRIWVLRGVACHPRDRLLAFLLLHDLPVDAHGSCHEGRDQFRAGFCMASPAADYSPARALALLLADEGAGGHGFFRRARLLDALWTQVEALSDLRFDAGIGCVLGDAVNTQAREEYEADSRHLRHLRFCCARDRRRERKESADIDGDESEGSEEGGDAGSEEGDENEGSNGEESEGSDD